MQYLVFSYGTLLLSGVQESVIGRQIAGKPDRLAGHRKSSVRDGDTSYPNIVSAEGEYVDGFILEVSEDELARMDMYEGGLYTRVKVTLESGAEAWVYRA
ncbi:MAG: gamma-glutamylcyclotransferase [Candidatus Hydrogenedentes bacterium]|nr:gamma-glutamylcyclotransferase [Candidatus Hydrogenedentota bacterium]